MMSRVGKMNLCEPFNLTSGLEIGLPRLIQLGLGRSLNILILAPGLAIHSSRPASAEVWNHCRASWTIASLLLIRTSIPQRKSRVTPRHE
jgi:hypothetical protein